MKRVLLVLISVILLTSIVSADIIINEEPKDLYNLGEVIKIPAKIATASELNDFLSVKLICNGIESEIHKQYISLNTGEEQSITIAIPLIPNFIGTTTGTCVVKPVLGNDFIITKEFTISNYIAVNLELEETEFDPGQSMILKGTAVKDNGENTQGFIDLKFISESQEEKFALSDTIKNSQINLNVSIPDDLASGIYIIQASVYEKGSNNNKTNQGYAETDIRINQLPSNLEILFGTRQAEPGEDFEIKGVLHDQTGEKIDSNVEIKVRNSDEKLIASEEVSTDEYMKVPLKQSEPAAEWMVYAESNGIESERSFEIIEKEDVEVEILNRTVLLTNIGNVPYNDTVEIKIGNDTIELDAFIPVEKEQKYTLSAPEGEYEVEINYGDDKKVNERVMLTGNAISVEEVSGLGSFFSSFVWIFMILILGFIAFTVYKKGYKKTFLGRVIRKRKRGSKKSDKDIVSAESLVNPKHIADLSLSIKGHKQEASIICLKVKNQDKILKNKKALSPVRKALEKVSEIAEDNKASVYENKENIFFIFAPARTKTFKNKESSVKTAQKIKEILDTYNKLAKYKIKYGIGINFGQIIAKHNKNMMKFMSTGTLITKARKLASHSQEKILLSEDMNNKVRSKIKSEKHSTNKLDYYSLNSIKQKKPYDKKFISNFVKKLEEDKAKRKAKQDKKKKSKSSSHSSHSK